MPSEITSKANYLNRRAFMQGAGAATIATLAGPAGAATLPEERGAAIPGIG
jgi:hypothetical protein